MHDSVDSFELREPKFMKYTGIFGLLFFFALLVASVFSLLSDHDYTGALFCGLCFGGFCLLAVFILLLYQKHRLMITPGKCCCSTLWKRRTFDRSDIRLIKVILLLLSALSLAATIVPLFYVKSTTLSLIWCIAPLLVYVPSLLFPEAVVLEKPAYASKAWKKTHVSFPLLPFLLPCLLMAILSDMLRVVEKDRQFLLGFLLFLLLLLPYLLCRPSHARKKSTVILFSLLLLCYSFGASFHLNNGLPSGTAQHNAARVLEADINTNPRTAPHCALSIADVNGTPVLYHVSKSMYQAALAGDPLVICTRTSIFGIHTQTIHKGNRPT